MKFKLISTFLCWILIASPSFAAFNSATVWELRTTGADTNGGAFDPGVTSPGTDETATTTAYTDVLLGASATGLASGTYTSGITATGATGQTCVLTSFNNSLTGQQVTVALTGSNTIAGSTALTITWAGSGATSAPTSATAGNGTATCSGTATISTTLGVTTASSVANPFTSTTHGPGNFLNVASGSGCTVQRVEIVAQAAGVATFDKALGTAASTCSGTLGGPLLTFSTLFSNTVPGNRAWVKAGTYSISSGLSWTTSCTNITPCQLDGYTSSHGDLGQATIQASGSVTTMFSDSGNFHWIRNLIIDGNSKTTTSGGNITGSSITFDNVTIQAFTVKGITFGGSSESFTRGTVQNGVSGCTAAINIQGRDIVQFSRITANACHGISITTGGGFLALRNIIDSNTGASTDGINISAGATGTTPQMIQGNDIDNNGRHGIFGAVSASLDSTQVVGNIISRNATDGINSLISYPLAAADYNAFWNNGGDTGGTTTHNLINYPQGAHDACAASCLVTISGSPFVTPGTNFALNSTTGAGAVLRAAGFPGAMPSGGTGYLDMGALQHQDTGGGVTPVSPIVQ